MNGILSPLMVRTQSVWIAGLLLCMGVLTPPIQAASSESELTKAVSPTLIAQASVSGLSPEDVVRGVTQDVINYLNPTEA